MNKPAPGSLVSYFQRIDKSKPNQIPSDGTEISPFKFLHWPKFTQRLAELFTPLIGPLSGILAAQC